MKKKKRRRVAATTAMSKEEERGSRHCEWRRGRGWVLLEEEKRREEPAFSFPMSDKQR